MSTWSLKLDEARIRMHLAHVAVRLRNRTQGSHDPLQAIRRTWAIQELGRNRRFEPLPRNTFVAGRTPVFRDAAGNLCAVAHLLAASGASDVVERVSNSQNLARVRTITEPGILRWAQAYGLTQRELEEIQPSYTFVQRSSSLVMMFGGVIGFMSLLVGFATVSARHLFDFGVARKAAAVAALCGAGLGVHGIYINISGSRAATFRVKYEADPNQFLVAILLLVMAGTILVIAHTRQSRSNKSP